MSSIKKIEITGKEVVVQNNIFLDSPKNLTLQEYKLFMFLISKVDPSCDNFSIFRVTALEFARAIDVENSTYIYRDLQVVTKRLMERVVKIHQQEDQLLVQTHLVSSVHYWYGEGYVDIKISEDMKPHLLKLKREFTQYKLSQITTLSSIYAIKIYELLKKLETFGKRTFFIDDLKNKLNITHDKYKKINDFKIRVLDIAKREINAKTDVIIDFKFIKAGRKITAVQFDITSKDEHKEKQKNLYCIRNQTDAKQVKEVVKLGYTASQAKNTLSYTEFEDAENAINSVKNQIKKGSVKNPKAMLRTALKEKWQDCDVNHSNKKTKSEKTRFMKIFEYLFMR